MVGPATDIKDAWQTSFEQYSFKLQQAREGGIGTLIDLYPTVLVPDREWLARRIDARLVAMMEDGAVEEVRALLARPDLVADAPVRRAIGVRPIAAMLAGTCTPAAALAEAQLRTRQYAKRQHTWFARQPPLEWPRAPTTLAAQAIILRI